MIVTFDNEFAFLSNFFPARVTFDRLSFPTVEHAYQAAKTLDSSWRKRIRTAPTPSKAKRLGRKVPLRPNWETVKVDVMLELLRQKFAAPEMKKLLLETNNQMLVEGNTWHDNFWGVCRCGECSSGQNRLGRLLMEVRDELMQNQ